MARFVATHVGTEGPTPGAGGLLRKNVDNFGRSVLSGDFNNDGHEDLLVGAPYYDDEVNASGEDPTVYGALYVIWGPLHPNSQPELAEAGELGSVTLDLAAGSAVQRVVICPDKAGLPDLANSIEVGQLDAVAVDGLHSIQPSAAIALAAGDWWLVATVSTALGETDGTELGFNRGETARSVLCRGGDSTWARVHGMDPKIQVALADPIVGKMDGSARGNTIVASYHGVRPNPTAGGSRFAFTLARAGEVRVSIFDARGRLVREIGPLKYEAGDGVLSWDGRAGNGATVASGVYHARFEAPGLSAQSRLLILR